MKTIIAIKGKSKTGKSTTLKKVYKQLKAKYPSAHITHEKITVGITDDVRVIMEVNGQKIGIESLGDYPGDLNDSLDLFIREQCVIIVCATRTKCGTVDAVERLKAEFQFHISWKDKFPELDSVKQEQISNDLASEIVSEIEKIIATSL